ncbi:Lytic transglycosylase catalytic [Thermocrinis albus DSM 14484]|uniref:Lytic transglycosylase catalytic n=1 Tax=Thermocrinis albus (strain DSM 14484 / JCM 11386 / HI 11/12) TaxID=638303 RepID=D3SP11_THEAH|nr:lytic transglycosylase domain-containing protein [Thermocrinis albus]ADC88898.1 Lytic transglycosylase catalytic [Thermocrinis albus DSM 14484]
MRVEGFSLPLKITRDKHIQIQRQEAFEETLQRVVLSSPAQDIKENIKEIVKKVSAKYGVPEGLLWAVMEVESGFKPNAYNRNRDGTEDIGIMQINYQHNKRLMKEYGITDPKQLYQIDLNIELGARILYENYRRYGDWVMAVKAYNGIRADNWDYVRRVISKATGR